MNISLNTARKYLPLYLPLSISLSFWSRAHYALIPLSLANENLCFHLDAASTKLIELMDHVEWINQHSNSSHPGLRDSIQFEVSAFRFRFVFQQRIYPKVSGLYFILFFGDGHFFQPPPIRSMLRALCICRWLSTGKKKQKIKQKCVSQWSTQRKKRRNKLCHNKQLNS